MVTGSHDGLINIFSLSSTRGEASFTLIGHQQNVCALHSLPDGTIISGSWDQCVLFFYDVMPLSDPLCKDSEGLEELDRAVRTSRPYPSCLGRPGSRL